ncbi:hypothetical protein ECANGB1_448 [Enterospora canceri]|uniref:Uncharacterized protein n=1 Tax=Enterospora canceri TaxID=1081671 RepID=A0A1Y1S7Z8_9MICR|nr:hypothetical protein ECANGB1_448 [Enterospora canceri]
MLFDRLLGLFKSDNQYSQLLNINDDQFSGMSCELVRSNEFIQCMNIVINNFRHKYEKINKKFIKYRKLDPEPIKLKNEIRIQLYHMRKVRELFTRALNVVTNCILVHQNDNRIVQIMKISTEMARLESIISNLTILSNSLDLLLRT